MNKVIGVVNCHDGPRLGKLTEKHPLGLLPFLGRYCCMDFPLSNFSNSGINKLYVLCEGFSTAVRNHIQNGQVWVSNTKTGYLKIAINEKALSAPKFNTDIYNINVNMAPLNDLDADYIVVAPAFFINTMNYEPIVNKHIASKADITVVYTHIKKADKEFINCDTIKISPKTNNVLRFGSNSGLEKEADISLETFVFSKKAFIELCSMTKRVSELYTLRRMVRYGVDNKLWKVKGIEFTGFTVPMLTLKDYVNYSFQFLDPDIRTKLFKPNWQLYTSTHDTPPALFTKDANVSNSFIANGSVIKGTVKNSILSRNVYVEKGAVIENSIIFAGGDIGENCKLNYVLTDDSVTVSEVKRLSGDMNDILFIKEGAKV